MQSTHTPDIQKTLEDAGVALRFYAQWMRENPPQGDDGHSHRYPFGEDTERNVRAALDGVQLLKAAPDLLRACNLAALILDRDGIRPLLGTAFNSDELSIITDALAKARGY